MMFVLWVVQKLQAFQILVDGSLKDTFKKSDTCEDIS